jgi:DNA-binding CsgD family transcriptional regulator
MNPQPVGRDADIAAVLAFLHANTSPIALAISGDPGIGKTVVWNHIVQAASRSSCVLLCRPASAERSLAFSALDDLLSDVVQDVLPALEWPRRKAVETALALNAAPGLSPTVGLETGAPPDRRVIARGILDVLRHFSAEAPLVVAVDDAQWLDRPSASVLEFCFRRLERWPVSILVTYRTGGPVPLGLDRALPPDRLRHMQLGPLSLGAIGEIVRTRLGVALPRYVLTRLYDSCGGNPFYAIEGARALLDHPHASVGNEPLPIPENLSSLVQDRLGRLTPAAREVARMIAASPDPRERLIRAAHDDGECWSAIDQAIDAGVIERASAQLRFTHPLFRSALYGEMTLNERRLVHQRLAARTAETEARAWHLALAADRPSQEVAAALDAAAVQAESRGAPQAAAALAEHATRLTPSGASDAVSQRTLRAADCHFRAGDFIRSRELIKATLDTSPAGPLRSALLIRLATIDYHEIGWPQAEQLLLQVAQEASDPALRAHAEQDLAVGRLIAGVLPDAMRWARASERSAELAANRHLMAHSLARIAALEFFQGNGFRSDLLEQAEALDGSGGLDGPGRIPLFGPGQARGLLLKWCDRLDDARLSLVAQYRHALDIGDEASAPFLLYNLAELECWAGNWQTAEEYAVEGCRAADESRQRTMKPATLYSLALVRAHRGQVQDSRDLASEALALCGLTGNFPVATQVISVLGFIALSVDDHLTAHSHLGKLGEMTTAFGLGEPSVVKFLPDEVEVLAALGETDRARSLAAQLETQGRSLGRPWAQATGARCRAHIAAIDGNLEAARHACQQALFWHEKLSMPFELGRTLLVQGLIERRARHRTAAHAALDQALGIFERLGAPLWAEKVRRELTKFTGRSTTQGLTETERRVAELIGQGRTNREVAAIMFVTENTVQTHIRHIFLKLGVRSRTELAAHLFSVDLTDSGDSRRPIRR